MNRGEWYSSGDTPVYHDYPFEPFEEEAAPKEKPIPQPLESPGEPGSKVPGIEAFHEPTQNPEWQNVFTTIHFGYNNSYLKGRENLDIVTNVSQYMKKHPKIYVFIEGHCDERGAEAYNLALGSRRSQTVRNELVKRGVNPDRIFTISYGKERPFALGHNEEAWAQNRRGAFKVYESQQ